MTYEVKACDQSIQMMIEAMGMKLHCYDPDVKTNNEPVFELIDVDNLGLGVRSYFDIVQQVEQYFQDHKENIEVVTTNSAIDLLKSIVKNASEEDILNFLEFQCAFSEREAKDWLNEAKDLLE
jgi:acetaldehyde dehydrogenase (acetylating)